MENDPKALQGYNHLTRLKDFTYLDIASHSV
jgi:hypothetical protein